jgi:hypothetical protein
MGSPSSPPLVMKDRALMFFETSLSSAATQAHPSIHPPQLLLRA